jgi:transcriptional regulator of arginine metabolism
VNINATGNALRRRDEILRLVREAPVRSQEELASLLSARGYSVAQPTLSRDLKDLGLAKSASGYVVPETAPAGAPGRALERLSRVLREFTVTIAPAASLVVVKTSAAGADPVARALDEWDDPNVSGTIAGEDTVFVATPGTAEAGALCRRLTEILSPSRTPRTPRPSRPARERSA